MNAAEFERAGVYDPKAPNAADRLALLEWLASRGATLAQMVDAHRSRALLYLGGRLALRPGPYLTLHEVADRIGVPLAQVEAFRLALALPPVAPDAPTFTESEARLFGRFADGVALFGERPMLRLARVLGGSLARIAEAMVAMNRESQLAALETAGTELAFAQANLRAIEAAGAPADMIHALLPMHLDLAGGRLRRGRTSAAAETTRLCVGFVDLVGFTTLSRHLAAPELASVVERFEETAHELATTRKGRVVKFIGDEVMFVTTDAAAACDIALALIERFAGDETVTPRGGLATGEILDRAGDYYGPIVNLAARLADIAVPGEVLISEEIAADPLGADLQCHPAGRRMLRGFDAPVAVLSVTRTGHT